MVLAPEKRCKIREWIQQSVVQKVRVRKTVKYGICMCIYLHGVQVQQTMKKANGMLAFITRGFRYRSKEVLLQLYRALVKPRLAYCVQFWSPNLRKDILVNEAVQCGLTRLIPGMDGLSYEERLKRLGLYSLEFKRMRGSYRNI